MNKHSKMIRFLAACLSLAALLSWAASASAQQCDAMLERKRFTLVLPYTPGGGFDGYARLFTSQFEELTGSTMRIRNLPGAGSMIGINAVAEAAPADLVLGMFNPVVLLNDKILGRDVKDLSEFALLGSLFTDTTTWVKREQSQVQFESPEPRLFALASNTEFTRILLPAYALGWDINLVRGYNGSTEGMFALLRGDVDFFYSSSISLVNQIRSMEGLIPFLSLTDRPNPVFPGISYLAGEGGVVEQLLSDHNAEQQHERQEIARLTVELSKTYRALAITSNAEPALLDCLQAVIEAAAFGEQIQTLAAAQNLVIEPVNGATLQDEIGRSEALIENNWDLLQELVARSR